MSWNNGRTQVVWIVQRISTGKLIAVYDRLSFAKQHVADDATCKWTRMQINMKGN